MNGMTALSTFHPQRTSGDLVVFYSVLRVALRAEKLHLTLQQSNKRLGYFTRVVGSREVSFGVVLHVSLT